MANKGLSNGALHLVTGRGEKEICLIMYLKHISIIKASRFLNFTTEQLPVLLTLYRKF